MPIIFSGSKMQGGAGVSQMDPYASTFLSGFGQGLNLGAASVSRGADMAEQRRQDAQRQGEWDRQYGLQRQAFDYRRQQDAQARQDDQTARKQSWDFLKGTPILAGVMGGQQAAGGEYPGYPGPARGASPDLSALSPDEQMRMTQQAHVQQMQMRKLEALNTGFQRTVPALIQTIAQMPEGKSKAAMMAHAQQLPQMFQVDPEGTMESAQKMLYAASGEIGEDIAFKTWAEDGMPQYAKLAGLNEGQSLALQVMVQSGGLTSKEEVNRAINEIQQADRAVQKPIIAREILTEAMQRAMDGNPTASDLVMLRDAKMPGIGEFIKPETQGDIQKKVQGDERWQRAKDASDTAFIEWRNAMADADKAAAGTSEDAIKAANDREMAVRNRYFASKEALRKAEAEVRRGASAKGGGAPAAGAAGSGTSGARGESGPDQSAKVRAVQQAWKELGANADPAKVAERAGQILGQ